jgi:hypothetical protein
MSWGVPPKYKQELNFSNVSTNSINQSVINALINLDFKINENSLYFIASQKKLKLTIMSIFTFSRPKVDLTILITAKGKVTFKSRYIYNSSFDTPFNDFGKQKREVILLIEEFKDIVKLNNR